MSLRSTIRQIQARDSDATAIADNKEVFIKQWLNDLNKLYETVQSNLTEFVKDRLLSFKSLNFEISEENLGDYKAPGLSIMVASREIYFNPVARITSGGAGRVDIFRTDRPSQSDRLSIVRRIQEDSSLVWFIEEYPTRLPDYFTRRMMGVPISYTAISNGSLERALDYLLRL